MSDCVFCAIVDGIAPAHRIDEDDRTVAFMDINPATDGHALVVPRRHVENLWDVEESDAAAVMAAAHRLARRMRTALRPDGINLLQATGRVAFQTVFHFHVHVLPRYENDSIKMPWTPTAGDQARIAELAERIRRASCP